MTNLALAMVNVALTALSLRIGNYTTATVTAFSAGVCLHAWWVGRK